MSYPVTLPIKPWRPMNKGHYFPPLEIPEQGISLEDVERELIEIALKQAGGNRTQAARLLGISRDTLRYRIKKFDLINDFRRKGHDSGSEADDLPPDTAGLNG